METGNRVTNETVYVCTGCKEQYTNPDAAGKCEASHKDGCLHRTCAFTGMITGRDILVRRTCLKCGVITTRTLVFEAMEFWPLMKDSDVQTPATQP